MDVQYKEYIVQPPLRLSVALLLTAGQCMRWEMICSALGCVLMAEACPSLFHFLSYYLQCRCGYDSVCAILDSVGKGNILSFHRTINWKKLGSLNDLMEKNLHIIPGTI